MVGGQAGTRGGSSGSGGSAGRSGELPLPDGCQARGSTETAETCSLAAFCGATPNVANCTRLESGRWQCSCELAHEDRIYEIDGAPGLAACAVAIGLCDEDELDLGTERCSARTNVSGPNSCALDLACEKPITVSFARGVAAGLMQYVNDECARPQENQPFGCTCETSGTVVAYGLLADRGEDACRPLADFCRSGREPHFEGPLECFDSNVSSTNDVCSLDQDCATKMRLTDDVSLAALEPRHSTCQLEVSGSSCNCSDRDSVFEFRVDQYPTQETCTLAIANCDPDADIRVSGETECQPTSETTSNDSCEADLGCEQEASVNSRTIVAKGRLLVYCRRLESGQPWRCSCASNQDSTIFEFGGESMTSLDVCASAPAGCLERMGVFVGPYGELMPPPDPFDGQ